MPKQQRLGGKTVAEVIDDLKDQIRRTMDIGCKAPSVAKRLKMLRATLEWVHSAANWQRKAERLWPILGVREKETLVQAAERVTQFGLDVGEGLLSTGSRTYTVSMVSDAKLKQIDDCLRDHNLMIAGLRERVRVLEDHQ